MLRIARTHQEYRDAGALHTSINLFGFWDQEIFLTKSGEPGLVLRVEGADYECLDHAGQDQVVKRFEAALRSLDAPIRFYQALIKSHALPVPACAHPNPQIQAASEQRSAFIDRRAEQMFHLQIAFVLIWELAQQTSTLWNSPWRPGARGGKPGIFANFAASRGAAYAEKHIESLAQQLRHRASSFARQLDDVLKIEMLSAEEAFRVLYALLNPSQQKRDSAHLLAHHGIDYQLSGTQIEAHRGHLRLDDHYVKVLTVKEPAAETWPLILRDLLEIKACFNVVTEWKPIESSAARRLIQSRRRHFHNSKTSFLSNLSAEERHGPRDELVDDSKEAAIADLGACLTAIGQEGKYFGEFSLSVIVYDEDLTRLEKIIPEFQRALTKHDGVLFEERYNLLNAFFATIPGNHAFNLRRFYLLNTNYADLSFLFSVDNGHLWNRQLNSEYLAVLETDQGIPYYLNLHNQDVAHTLILGATGSGKSFLLNFLIQSLQKYEPQTYIFDLGASFEGITSIFRGSYLNVGPDGQAFTINPFSLNPIKENLNFLHAFLRVLLESAEQQELTGVEERSLYAAIERMYRLEAQTRTLTNLAAMIGPLGERLYRWTRAGQFGHVFDNVEDTLTLQSFQTFNFDATSIYPDVLEPLLFYILHRASTAIDNPQHAAQFKVLILDEAWIFLRNQTIREYVTRAQKTWRKKNAAMILATQSLHELAQSRMLEIVAESCPNKIFLANPDIDVPVYREAFHLNDTELELLAGLVPKRELLLKNQRGAKKLHLNVDSFSYWMATNTPKDNVERKRYFDQYGVSEGLTRLARDHPVDSL